MNHVLLIYLDPKIGLVSLANFARTKGRTMTWLGSGPEETVQLAADDCNSMS